MTRRTGPLALAAALLSTAATACDETVRYDQFDGHDYAFLSREADLDSAQAACADLGMALVTIESSAEQDFLVERAFLSTPEHPDTGYLDAWFWVGAVNDELDGRTGVQEAMAHDGWHWLSGAPMTFTDFSGEMDDDAWNLDEHGAGVTVTGPWTEGPRGGGHQWRISPASYARAFVCESS